MNDEEAREAEQRIDDQLKVLADKLAAKTPEIEDLYLKKAWMVNDIAEKVGANRKAVMMVLTVRGHIKPHSPRVNPDLWIWRKGCDDAFSGHLSKIGVEATLDAEGYEIYDLDECYQAYRNGIAFRSGTNLKKRK